MARRPLCPCLISWWRWLCAPIALCCGVGVPDAHNGRSRPYAGREEDLCLSLNVLGPRESRGALRGFSGEVETTETTMPANIIVYRPSSDHFWCETGRDFRAHGLSAWPQGLDMETWSGSWCPFVAVHLRKDDITNMRIAGLQSIYAPVVPVIQTADRTGVRCFRLQPPDRQRSGNVPLTSRRCATNSLNRYIDWQDLIKPIIICLVRALFQDSCCRSLNLAWCETAEHLECALICVLFWSFEWALH